MRRIAITGGIAEGKSTVLSYLREEGYSVESSDRIARQVFQSPEVQEAIAQVLSTAPPVSPDALRSRMGEAEVRRAVNTITHPLIVKALRSTDASFLEVPLLIEACMQGEFDRVWVVTCGAQEQLRRLAERIGIETATRLVRTQLATRAKIPFADALIRTNQDESSVKRFVTVVAQRDLR